jgi:chitodextrinase
MKRSALFAVGLLLLSLAIAGCGFLNQTPTVQIIASPASGDAPLDITFTAKATDDGQIVLYEWDFGNGNVGSGKTANTNYPNSGTYTVTVTVTDDGGKTARATQTIQVFNPGPLCDGISVKNITGGACTSPFCAGDVLRFFPQNARHPEGKDITAYKWDFGDGTINYGSTVDHRFMTVGQWNVVLTLTDSEGVSNSFSKQITVQQCCYCLPKIFIEKVSDCLLVGHKITLRGNWEDRCCACSEETSTHTLNTLSLLDSQGICPEAPPCDPCPCPCPSPCYDGKWEWRISYNGDLVKAGSNRYITFVPCCAGEYKVFLYYTCGSKSTYTTKTFEIE